MSMSAPHVSSRIHRGPLITLGEDVYDLQKMRFDCLPAARFCVKCGFPITYEGEKTAHEDQTQDSSNTWHVSGTRTGAFLS